MQLSQQGLLILVTWGAFIAGFVFGLFWCGRPRDDDPSYCDEGAERPRHRRD